MRRATFLLATLALALGLAVEPFDDGLAWLPDLLTGCALAGCALACPRSRVGPLLAAAAVLWFAAWPTAIAYRTPLALAVLSPPERRRPSLAVALLCVALALPRPASSLPAAVALAACTVLAGALRREALPGAAVLGAAMAGAAFVTHALPGTATVAVLSAYGAAIVVASAVTVFTVARADWRPVELADELAGADTIDAFRDALADAVGDPSLSVAFAATAATAAADRERTQVDDAWLEHRVGALDDEVLRAAVSAATRLQAANVRLQRDLSAQAEALAASGRRLLAAGDEQRCRLERRVRAGPLARLEALDERLERLGEPALAAVRSDLATSLEELRTLAFDLHPGSDAIATLAARSPVPAPVVAGELPDLAPEARRALLFSCGEALANVAKHAAATRVEIRIAVERGSVILSVADDGRGGADPAAGTGLVGLRDRLELLGGTLTLEPREGGGTRLLAAVPAGTAE